MENYNYDPYFDRYSGNSDHRKKDYTRVLAVPGRAEQAAEFNEIQSIQRDYLERLGNSMYSNGGIISGCKININGTQVTIESGEIFLSGLIRRVDEATVTITGSGEEKIIASLETSIVTASQDETLRDPAVGADNYNLIGADRERQRVVIKAIQGNMTSGDNNSGILYEIKDGELINDADQNTSNPLAFVDDILAERTFDENGNYKVNGLTLKNVAELTAEDLIKIYISAGRAYIKGYQVIKNAMSDINLERSTSKRTVLNEPHTYSVSNNKVKLSNGPIAEMKNLNCYVSVSKERVYRGSIGGGTDALSKTPVFRIVRVWTEGVGAHEYVNGVDYTLTDNKVDWSLTGDTAQEPESGTTYFVNYEYSYSMVEGQDFDLSNELDEAYVTFREDGTKPIQNTIVSYTYDYTLYRRDLIMLDSKGNFLVVQGSPDRYEDLITPYNGSDAYIELGYVNVFPKPPLPTDKDDRNYIAEVVSYDDTRLTQDNFISMLRRIGYLEDSIAQLDLERQIESGEDTSSLRGYFTDNFENINKSDLVYDVEDVKYTATIDTSRKELTTSSEMKSTDVGVDDGKSSGYEIFGTIISAPYEYENAITQEFATGTMLVNPYASYGPMCKVELDPPEDNWVDENKILVTNTAEKKSYETQYKTVTKWVRNGHAYGRFEGSKTSTSTTYTGSSTSVERDTSTTSSIIEFMRVKDVNITGSAFGEDAENIYCTFNGQPIDLIATGETTQGIERVVDRKNYKTVNANRNGYFTAKITVPENTPCGTVEVKLVRPEPEEESGVAIYTAVGTLLTSTITDTTVITHHYTVLQTTTNTYSSDPLAQSFILSSIYDRNLSKINLYFATKDENRPAVVQVRNMVNGYPGETVYAEVLLNPEDVNVPSNPKAPVATEVILNQPVYCYANTQYCFVVLSDSNKYSMYYAELGQTILNTEQQLVVNPYGVGVMFSSSNATTWTAHQGADLKFELYSSKYTGNGEIIFDEADANEVSGVFLDAAYEVEGDSENASINRSSLTWYYRYRNSNTGEYSEWLPIDTLTYRDFGAIADKIGLRAVINTDFNTSPFIDSGRVSLRGFLEEKEGTYISRHLSDTDFDEKYQMLKISYQVAEPTGASHKPYYMDDPEGDWVEITGTDDNHELSITKVDEEFSQYTWEIKKLKSKELNPASDGSNFFKFRFDLSTSIRYNKPRIKNLIVIFKYE